MFKKINKKIYLGNKTASDGQSSICVGPEEVAEPNPESGSLYKFLKIPPSSEEDSTNNFLSVLRQHSEAAVVIPSFLAFLSIWSNESDEERQKLGT